MWNVIIVLSHTGIKQIKDLASSVDKLTSTVVEKAEDVSRNTQDIRAQRELDTLRRKWASEVKQLTQIIDDIIDPSDFMAKSGKLLGNCCWWWQRSFRYFLIQKLTSGRIWRGVKVQSTTGSGRSSAGWLWVLLLRLAVRWKLGKLP